MTQTIHCTISQQPNNYDIEIGYDFLWNSQKVISLFPKDFKFAIITQNSLAKVYGRRLQESFSREGFEANLFTFPDGEKFKNRETKALLEDRILEKKWGRKVCVIALGGGVVIDLAGFIAATYCRGVPLIVIPTSLLAMVDSSLGGKTGVNTPLGKNLIGSIYQPHKVLIDLSFLQTLPLSELRNGVAEMIKHGIIADPEYFSYLEAHVESLLNLDFCLLEKAIFDSCRIKMQIVAQDEKENGKRVLLNFGHTVGHALESLTGYSLPHGEAVAIGMLAESHIAMQIGLLSSKNCDRLFRLLLAYGLPHHLPQEFSFEQIYEAMRRDKKSVEGNPRFVLIKEIGKPLEENGIYCFSVDKPHIQEALAL